jgi:hypothetical protein
MLQTIMSSVRLAVWTPRVAAVVSTLGSPFIVTAVAVALVVLRLGPSLSELLLWGAIGLVCGAGIPIRR